GSRSGAVHLRLPFGALFEDRQTVEQFRTNERVKASTTVDAPISTLTTVRVLVVEDEPDLADAISRGLRREGYAVDVAHDGGEAVEKLSYTTYDLVCLDLTLPRVDGREVCRQIRAGETASSDARVLMLTA